MCRIFFNAQDFLGFWKWVTMSLVLILMSVTGLFNITFQYHKVTLTMIIKISIRATKMSTLTISTMIILITLITLISSNTCGRWRWCHLRPPPSPTDKIRQIWPFRQNTNWPPKFSAISPLVQWRDVIVAQRQLTQKRFFVNKRSLDHPNYLVRFAFSTSHQAISCGYLSMFGI